jgi:hypothetical protein
MIDPASVAFDVDGVIADTMALFLDIARDEFDVRGIRYEDITCYNLVDCIGMDPAVIDRILSRILEGRYTRTLKAIPGAAAVLRRIARRAEPLLLVTARPQIGPVDGWVRGLLADDAAGVTIVATGGSPISSRTGLKPVSRWRRPASHRSCSPSPGTASPTRLWKCLRGRSSTN